MVNITWENEIREELRKRKIEREIFWWIFYTETRSTSYIANETLPGYLAATRSSLIPSVGT